MTHLVFPVILLTKSQYAVAESEDELVRRVPWIIELLDFKERFAFW